MIGILLAAGFSRRFGISDKLLQALPDGNPIALASAKRLIEAIPLSIAVVRPENKALALLLQDAGLKVFFVVSKRQKWQIAYLQQLNFLLVSVSLAMVS